MEIICKSETRTQFVDNLYNMLLFLDGKVFEEKAKVVVNKDNRFADKCIAGFYSKRWIFHKFGIQDTYAIFEKCSFIDNVFNLDFYVTSVATHEVRHRFQYYNKETLISYEFLLNSKIFHKTMIEHLYKTMEEKYGKKSMILKREFDASFIEIIISSMYKYPQFTMRMVIALISSNEDTIENILNGQYK